jgi:hypothetical protein
MTRTLLNGIKFLLPLIIFTACSPVKNLQNNERILAEWNKHYLNDALKFSYAFPFDYQLFRGKEMIKKSLRNNNLYLNWKYCLAYFQTNVDPLLEQYLFYYKDKETADKELSTLGNYSTDSSHMLVDTVNAILFCGVPLENGRGFIYILCKSSQDVFRHVVDAEFEQICATIKTGEDYNNIAFTNPFELAQRYALNEDNTTNYLFPIEILLQKKKNYSNDVRSTHLYLQALATYQSFVVNLALELDTTIQQWDALRGYKNKVPAAGAAITDNKALEFLCRQFEQHKIVMINENHFSPKHRMLIKLILRKLYERGFRYLGLEMLWDNNINQRGFIINNSGFYTKEPMAANLVKEAETIGFTVFGYDNVTGNREKNQAENIYANTFQKDSLAKVIILAGFEHISEQESPRGNRMAMEFRKLYNINPLTVDQTMYKINTDHWLSIIDTIKAPEERSLQADIYVSNNLNYDKFAELSNYVDYVIEIPDSIINYINKQRGNDYIISIYRTADLEIDSTAVPAYNYKIKRPVTDKLLHIPLQKTEYVFFVKSKYNKMIFRNNIK